MGLRKLAFNGIRWNSAATILTAIGSIIQLYILIRYIDESDFGLMALINVVMAFAITFLDFGVSNGIIHKKEINRVQLSTLYWLTVIMGGGITLVIFFASPFIAAFFEEAQLKPLLQIIASVFFLSSFGQPFKIWMKRQMQFDKLAFITIISFFASFIAVVFFAIQGEGVYALIYGLLVRTVIETILALAIGWRAYRLQLNFKPSKIQFFVKFGFFQMGEQLLTFFAMRFDVLLIGKLLGTEILGVYDIFKNFLLRPAQMIIPIITNVSFPLMSKLQNDETRLSYVYLKLLNYICTLNFPIYLFLLFNSQHLISLMFGEDWLMHEYLFQLLSIGLLITTTGIPTGSLILAKGRADWGFYWNIGMFILMPAAIYIGSEWGVNGIALAFVLLQLNLIIPNYLFMVRPFIKTNYREYFSQLLKPLLLASVFSISSILINNYLALLPLVELFLSALVGGSIYLSLSFYFDSKFLEDLLTLVGHEKN